jgi:hypothetical protein
MKLRNAHGYELEAYFVFTNPVQTVQAPLEGLKLETYPTEHGLFRAARVTGDANGEIALEVLRTELLNGTVRWLELGLRGYALMEGKREYRPWRRNAHLGLEALRNLETLEPEVRYHAPS